MRSIYAASALLLASVSSAALAGCPGDPGCPSEGSLSLGLELGIMLDQDGAHDVQNLIAEYQISGFYIFGAQGSFSTTLTKPFNISDPLDSRIGLEGQLQVQPPGLPAFGLGFKYPPRPVEEYTVHDLRHPRIVFYPPILAGYRFQTGFGAGSNSVEATMTLRFSLRAPETEPANRFTQLWVDYRIDPVPEAPQWAMMIAGFGLAGAALRIRKRSVSFA